MDLATDEVCDLQCSVGCKHGGKLCRRWVAAFEARPNYVTALEESNAHLKRRAEDCWKLAWDCMSYIVTMRDEKIISKKAFAKLRERADELGIYDEDAIS